MQEAISKNTVEYWIKVRNGSVRKNAPFLYFREQRAKATALVRIFGDCREGRCVPASRVVMLAGHCAAAEVVYSYLTIEKIVR